MSKKPAIKIVGFKSTDVENAANKPTPPTVILKNTIKHEVEIQRIKQDIQKWRLAVKSAEYKYNPIRYNLYQLYRDVMMDAHITACWNQRKNMILGLEFEIEKDDKEVEELKFITESKWFHDFVCHALDSIMEGFSLVQFDTLENDEFKEVSLVNRVYVKPEFGIVTEAYTAITGVKFTEKPYSDWCIGVGDKYDLGLLMKLAPLYIWKKNALGAWADYQDLFGVPIRIGKTDVSDTDTRNNMEAMLKNMAVGAYGLFDTDDEIQLIESSNSDAFNVFDQMINRCNSEISKLILGQTGTTDEKAFVGSAEVHERVAKSGMYSDMKFIKTVLNRQLLPFLENLGFNFKGAKFDVEEDKEISLEERAKIDIQLLNTGLYKMEPEYIKAKYGTEMVELEQPNTSVKDVREKLKNIYGV